jgi:hypothetical protein
LRRVDAVSPALGLAGLALELVGLVGRGDAGILGRLHRSLGARLLALQTSIGSGPLGVGLGSGALLGLSPITLDLLLALLRRDLVLKLSAFALGLNPLLLHLGPLLLDAGLLGCLRSLAIGV